MNASIATAEAATAAAEAATVTAEAGSTTAGAADTRALGISLFTRWTQMWNGDLALAERIVTADFTIDFGKDLPGGARITGPAALVAFVAAHRASKDALSYRMHGEPVVDVTTGSTVCRYSATWDDPAGRRVSVSGIDMLTVRDWRISAVWSLGGERLFATDRV